MVAGVLDRGDGAAWSRACGGRCRLSLGVCGSGWSMRKGEGGRGRWCWRQWLGDGGGGRLLVLEGAVVGSCGFWKLWGDLRDGRGFSLPWERSIERRCGFSARTVDK